MTRRKGQSLAEFALTLPILLILIFGVIEFGRLFQAWVTIQNAARSAARYASTGRINYDMFEVSVPADTPEDIAMLDAIIPCIKDQDQRGTKTIEDGVEQYTGGAESLFATWYDGTDCEPSNEDHQQYRKDILRILSIMYEARDSSTSISLGPSNLTDMTPEKAADVLKSVWENPMPREEEAGFFQIHICSSRGYIDSYSSAYNGRYDKQRFVMVRNRTDAIGNTGDGSPAADYPFPYCMLNEVPPEFTPNDQPNEQALRNAGRRWWDPGGPGDRVTVSVRFNHPLITPLRGQTRYITMEARRSTINESFRAPRAIGAFQRSLPPGTGDDPGAVPSETPDPTEEVTATNTPFTPTATFTSTPTDEPFNCARLSVQFSQPPFSGRQFYMSIRNDNDEDVELQYVRLEWLPVPEYPAMYLAAMQMQGSMHWSGIPVPANQQPQTLVDTREHGQNIEGAYRTALGNQTAYWQGLFMNGPDNLEAHMLLGDFNGTFEFRQPTTGVLCTVQLIRPVSPTRTPTQTLPPDVTPTNTPNCATVQDQIRLRFGDFDRVDGSVYFVLNNDSGRNFYMRGFELVWPDATHPEIGLAQGTYRLRFVSVGGETSTDPMGQRVWEASSETQDSTGNLRTSLPYDVATYSNNAAEGSWLTNAIIPPGPTRIHLDFQGFTGSLSQFGVKAWHFNGTRFLINCDLAGGGNGNGDGDNGDVDFIQPSPTITFTPQPTKTPGPTFTPSKTQVPATPTQTFTPRPVTATFTPPPATFTPSRTPLGWATPPPSGGGES